MTEAEWLTCADPAPMLEFLQGGMIVLVDELPLQAEREAIRTFIQDAVPRKLRHFACWCSRRIWDELWDERSRKGIEVAERYADGLATAEQLGNANSAALEARNAIRGHLIRRIAAHVAYATSGNQIAEASSESANVVAWIEELPLPEARTEQNHILRCIFGNPFRPVAFDPAWRTSDVLALAQGIYAERAFDRMPILADALQDAGCNNDDILSHCRDTGTPHARGCWVVDLILGKL
jgi:hypothetical protein